MLPDSPHSSLLTDSPHTSLLTMGAQVTAAFSSAEMYDFTLTMVEPIAVIPSAEAPLK
jgi:hypothetical protein